MAVNQIKTRILNKISTWNEWQSVKDTFYPLRGEICIVEIPSSTSSTGLIPPATGIKVGTWNGIEGDPSKKSFGELPWIQAIAGDVTAWCKEHMADFDKFKVQVAAAVADSEGGLQNAIDGLRERVEALEEIVKDGNNSNTKLRQAITDVNGIVTGHTTELGQLTANKADKSQVVTDITAAKTAVLGEDAASSNKTVAGAYSAASDAAAQALADANLYTNGKVTDILGKNDDNSNFVGTVKGAYAAADAAQGKANTNASEITTIKGQIEEINETLGGSDGKSVSARLGALEAKDTELTAAISGNTDAIGEEVSRATGAEQALSERIARAEAFLNEATIDPDNTDLVDTLKELQEYITADESGAAAMAASIADAKQKLLGEADLAHYGKAGYSIKEIKIVADQAAADVITAQSTADSANDLAGEAKDSATTADGKAVAAQTAINKLIASSVAEDAGKISTIAFENGELKATRKAITMDDMDASATFIFYCGTALELI